MIVGMAAATNRLLKPEANNAQVCWRHQQKTWREKNILVFIWCFIFT